MNSKKLAPSWSLTDWNNIEDCPIIQRQRDKNGRMLLSSGCEEERA